jgi:hypothetical protein
MMRSILRSSPCTLRLLLKPQVDIRRDLEHTPLDTRLTHSSPSLHFPHMRHGCYLKRRHFAYSGTWETAMEKLWKKSRKKTSYRKVGLSDPSRTVRPKSDYPTHPPTRPPTGHPTYVLGTVLNVGHYLRMSDSSSDTSEHPTYSRTVRPACAQSLGPRPMYPFAPPRLYILFSYLRIRVS